MRPSRQLGKRGEKGTRIVKMYAKAQPRSLAARVTPTPPRKKSAASPGRLAALRLATSRAGERVRPARGEVNIMMPGELEPT